MTLRRRRPKPRPDKIPARPVQLHTDASAAWDVLYCALAGAVIGVGGLAFMACAYDITPLLRVFWGAD